MRLVAEQPIWKAGVESDTPLDRRTDTPLDGAVRALAWAVLGVVVAGCLTGLVLLLYSGFPTGAERSHDDMQYLQPDLSFGMAMRNLHRLFALALLFVAPFAIVRA